MTDPVLPDVQFEHAITRRIYEHRAPANPSCCNACATLLEALRVHALPRGLMELFDAAGIDPAKPAEVWGAPDQGFLAAWWVFVGTAASGSALTVQEPSPGLTWWITSEISMRPEPEFGKSPLLQLELSWLDPALRTLERAVWPLAQVRADGLRAHGA